MTKVLPGDKIYQAMEIEQGFMRPAILHGFGTSAKQRLPSRLAELAQFGWLPFAAALFGTAEWQPQWLHHNFLPVIGLRVHAKIPPSPLLSADRGIAWSVQAKSYNGKPVPCPPPGSGAHFRSPSSIPHTRGLAKQKKGRSLI